MTGQADLADDAKLEAGKALDGPVTALKPGDIVVVKIENVTPRAMDQLSAALKEAEARTGLKFVVFSADVDLSVYRLVSDGYVSVEELKKFRSVASHASIIHTGWLEKQLDSLIAKATPHDS